MNPIYQRYATATVRAALNAAATVLVQRGWIDGDMSGQLVAGLTLFIVALGWSWLEKHESQLKLLVALTLPAGTSEQAVEHVIASADTLPVVTTPKNVPPVA